MLQNIQERMFPQQEDVVTHERIMKIYLMKCSVSGVEKNWRDNLLLDTAIHSITIKSCTRRRSNERIYSVRCKAQPSNKILFSKQSYSSQILVVINPNLRHVGPS